MNSIDTAKYIMSSIINLLKSDEEYNLNDSDIFRLMNLSKSDIYSLNEIDEQVKIHDVTAQEYSLFRTRSGIPQTIDPIPYMHNNNIIHLKPIIIIPEFANTIKKKFIITHEICHLFSISEYKLDPLNKVYHHSFGINEYIYDCNMNLLSSNCNNRKNEIINNAISYSFIKIIENVNSPLDVYFDLCSYIIAEKNNIKSLIGAYFSGDIEYCHKLVRFQS